MSKEGTTTNRWKWDKKRFGYIAIVAVVALILAALYVTANEKSGKNVAGADEQGPGPTQINVSDTDPESVPSANADGANSYGEVLEDLDNVPGYEETLLYVSGLTRGDIEYCNKYETENGSLLKEYAANTLTVNSGPSESQQSGAIWEVYMYDRIEEAQANLTLPDGYVPELARKDAELDQNTQQLWSAHNDLLARLASAGYSNPIPAIGGICSNPRLILKSAAAPTAARPAQRSRPRAKPGRPGKQRPHKKGVCPPKVNIKPPRNSSPGTTPHHDGNPYTQPGGDGVKTATPGVTKDVPEDTKKDHDANRDTDGATDSGGSGRDSGGTTSDGGLSEETPDNPVNPSLPPANPNPTGKLEIVQ